jgi:hypothetical protein
MSCVAPFQRRPVLAVVLPGPTGVSPGCVAELRRLHTLMTSSCIALPCNFCLECHTAYAVACLSFVAAFCRYLSPLSFAAVFAAICFLDRWCQPCFVLPGSCTVWSLVTMSGSCSCQH